MSDDLLVIIGLFSMFFGVMYFPLFLVTRGWVLASIFTCLLQVQGLIFLLAYEIKIRVVPKQ